MNDISMQLPPSSVARSSRVVFNGPRPEFRKLVTRGALLEFCTAGFYRFWLATDMRRHVWSHTSVESDAVEYTGTAKELLIGFLVALAILAPIYLVYVLIGIEAERAKAFSSVPLFLFFYLFGQFAIYRARRYRASRTIWRGVRFWMTGSGWKYAGRAFGWSILTGLTIGIALPWREAALERYKMRHTFYGDLPGQFVSTGGQLFKRAWWLWAIAMLFVVAFAIMVGVFFDNISALQPTASREMGARFVKLANIYFFVALIAALFLYPIYKAITWRWWLSGIRFGSVRFESDLRNGALIGRYWSVTGWFILLIVLDLILIALAGVVFALAAGTWDFGRLYLLIIAHPYLTIGAYIANYVALVVALGVVIRLYLFRDIWERIANSVTVYGLEAADDVQARGDAVNALGEGFADSLNIGGF